MDIVRLALNDSSVNRSHQSDSVQFNIKPFGVEPEPTLPPIAAGLGLLLLAALAITVVTRKKKGDER